jgi:hypothetical protein
MHSFQVPHRIIRTARTPVGSHLFRNIVADGLGVVLAVIVLVAVAVAAMTS